LNPLNRRLLRDQHGGNTHYSNGNHICPDQPETLAEQAGDTSTHKTSPRPVLPAVEEGVDGAASRIPVKHQLNQCTQENQKNQRKNQLHQRECIFFIGNGKKSPDQQHDGKKVSGQSENTEEETA